MSGHAHERPTHERPVREGYYDIFEQDDTLYIKGPDLQNGNYVVVRLDNIYFVIYDITYREEGCKEEETIRVHIMTEI